MVTPGVKVKTLGPLASAKLIAVGTLFTSESQLVGTAVGGKLIVIARVRARVLAIRSAGVDLHADKVVRARYGASRRDHDHCGKYDSSGCRGMGTAECISTVPSLLLLTAAELVLTTAAGEAGEHR